MALAFLGSAAVRDGLQRFFALLAVATLLGAIVIGIASLLATRVGIAASVIDAIRPVSRPLAAAITGTCMLGSLYFSEIANYTPCRLCWYQRAAMYPLAVLLLVGAIRRWGGLWRVAVPLAAIGASISAYHWSIERFSFLGTGSCSADVPCTVPWFTEFGFVTLAFMAFAGFAAAVALVTIPRTPAQ